MALHPGLYLQVTTWGASANASAGGPHREQREADVMSLEECILFKARPLQMPTRWLSPHRFRMAYGASHWQMISIPPQDCEMIPVPI